MRALPLKFSMLTSIIPLKRRPPVVMQTVALGGVLGAFLLGVFLTYAALSPSSMRLALPSGGATAAGDGVVRYPTAGTNGTLPVLPFEQRLADAWRNGRETCEQWLNAQVSARSYLDFYIIGVQKGATSELSMRINDLGILRKQMEKEWHFFEKLMEPGEEAYPTTLHMPYTPSDLHDLRLRHYLAGFPEHEGTVTAEAQVPTVDGRASESRRVTYDATVEYMLSDRAAFLAHTLTPHAKVVLTVREPLGRALSQYNMMTRVFNKVRREEGGKPEMLATPERFDEIVRNEVDKLRQCGYNAITATVDRTTSALLHCMYEGRKHTFDDLLYVTRGLYHMHVRTWLEYFPGHRMHFVRFDRVVQGDKAAMTEVADFLCIRRWDNQLLRRYQRKGNDLSFGQMAAKKGLGKVGFESYEGKDRYMLEMGADTKAFLEEFYRPANARLEQLLGRKMWETT